MTEQREKLSDDVDLVVFTDTSRRTRYLALRLELRMNVEDLRQITGLKSEREIAAWLVEQRECLEENLGIIAGEENVGTPHGDLAHFAACDRESERLPAAGPDTWLCECIEHADEARAARAARPAPVTCAHVPR